MFAQVAVSSTVARKATEQQSNDLVALIEASMEAPTSNTSALAVHDMGLLLPTDCSGQAPVNAIIVAN